MRLLILGSLDGHIGAASKIAISKGGSVLHASDIEEGLKVLRSGQSVDAVMADVSLDVQEFIDKLELERMSIPVVACGVSNNTRAAVRAIKAGAKEYVPLPPDAELISAVLTAISQETRDLIFEDPITEQVIKLAKKIAPSEANILITGESGTGKEVFSRYIHDNSKRAENNFVAVNCAAIPEALLESELFGHEKGAFTGAVARRVGKFEEANNGTILLDEISEMDIRLQAKLLRVIQEREVDRIGSKRPVKVNVRIIATSNRNMIEEVKKGTFREDLFYRLNVVNIDLPALRERRADIIPLANFFAKKYAKLNEVEEKALSKDAKKLLKSYHWQGNVRELENTIHRAILIATEEEITPDAIMLTNPVANQTQENQEDGGEAEQDGATQPMVGRTVASVERDLIIDTLKHTLGNRTHAANILGISIRTLRNKLKLYKEDGYEIPTPE